MGDFKQQHPGLMLGPLRGRVCAVAAVGAIAASFWASRSVRDAVFQHGSEAFFWLTVSATAFNPMPLLAGHRHLVLPVAALAWLAVAMCILHAGDPMVIVEAVWRDMTARFTLLQISVFGSALLHVGLTLVLNIWPVMVQNVPHLQRYKIQQDKAPAGIHAWYHCAVHIFASQCLVQLPLITGQYFFLKYFAIPYDFDTAPGIWSLAWRLALALIIDDTWVYFGHRALHDKRIYKYIHKVHHTYTSPFAPDAEYEHPVETVVLGVGFFLACMFLTNHLAFVWAWLYVRLLVTYDSHSGYDLPFNLLHLIPCYNGAREHDWHHQFFNGNYAPTFLWWDRLFGTSLAFDKFERQRRAREAAKEGAEMERRGDAWYGKPGCNKAGEVETQLAPVPFTSCLVTGSEGVVGCRLVAMLAARGAKRIVCLDVVDGPTPAFLALAERCRREHGAELVYIKRDISSKEEMLDAAKDQEGPFNGIEVVFHLAALVRPFHEHGVYEKVNHQGAQHVLEAFARNGSSKNAHIVLVDCSTPSTRYPTSGNIDGLMEHEMVYQDSIHEYATSKARGEKAILAANGRKASSGNMLATCAVAPHQVYAPEDELFLPSMLEEAKAGRLRVFGPGTNIASFTHASNIAHGLIVAAAKLWRDGSKSPAAGEFFIVTDGGARSFWDVINDAVVECGLTSLYTKLHLPASLLWVIAYAGVAYTRVTGKFVKLTPFTLRMLLTNRVFCTAKARHILGYAPVISFEEGWAETMAAAKSQLAGGSKKVD